MLRQPLLAATLAAFFPAAWATTTCDDACLKRIDDGHALVAKGKYKGAFASFEAARAGAPQSSLPLSVAAGLLQDLSKSAAPEQADSLRKNARGLAQRALELDPDDVLAHEALRKLDEDTPSPVHQPNAAARTALDEAEVFFSEHKYPEALAKYQQAMALDPQASTPWVGAGDCYFFQKQYAQAEPLFRRATEIEPHNPQAWRFLADSLVAQGKRESADKALLAAIAADPSQQPSWGKLAALRDAMGLPLSPLRFRRGVSVSKDKDGKDRVVLDQDVVGRSDGPEGSFRLALALGEIEARAVKDKQASAFEVELHAWRRALQVLDDLGSTPDKQTRDPALRRLQAMAKDGQLEPALLLLMYRGAYRPALQAWLARDPGGVNRFIDRYGVRP
ncbi:tetratricopeptide repeat protein [Massilia sp. Dwa41.01b]|uniref:tetratricopeptide repeat protein n=1 Tax=Massilia sp. Dwa41.01b TaxID=2709302 RepID=UPI0016015480|nr:tetratricopeptide repeat protein [Massilia sp. Dwa41.01b]QNA88810.1 tetratricopeptide repeat protein [Massilia sp. Dwa41.01b]